MNIKGGVAYIDFKGRSLTLSSGTIEGVFKNIVDAWESKKMLVICNAKWENEVMPFIAAFPVRKRSNTQYVFSLSITHISEPKVVFKYVVIGSTNNVIISDATIG